MQNKPRIGIIGTGAMGGFYGLMLAKGGHDVHFLLRSDYSAVAAEGWQVESAGEEPFRINPAQAELIGISDPVSGKSWALSSTRLVVGRVDSCDIHLDDPSVSSEHARLTHDSEGWRVANLLSTNGTFVNDEKISNRALNDGDRLRFGRVELRFHGPQAPSKSRPGWLPWAVAAVALAIVAGIVIVLI